MVNLFKYKLHVHCQEFGSECTPGMTESDRPTRNNSSVCISEMEGEMSHHIFNEDPQFTSMKSADLGTFGKMSKLEKYPLESDLNLIEYTLGGITIDQHEKGELDTLLSAKTADESRVDKSGELQPNTETTVNEKDDPIFNDIMDRVGRHVQKRESDTSIGSSNRDSSDGQSVRVSENFTSIPYGFQPRGAYDHGKKNTEIMGVAYNGRMRQFVILDAKGIITWNRSMVETKVERGMCYPKYEYRLITDLVYARKYNCYFALGKDFSLKVLNRDFEETCSVSANLRSVLFMVFNPARDELITGGVGGTKIWIFHQVASVFQEIRPMANYRLTLKSELSDVGGSWVKRVELDQHLQHLYCCSDTDLYAYDLNGNLLFRFEKAHTMSITGCKYSIGGRSLITTSLDTEVKVWSLLGGLVHTFRGHSRAVTDVVIHPDSSYLFITCSLDGTVRLWSLETMEALCSLVVSVDGVLWMGLTDDKLLYLSTVHAISLWSFNQFFNFWSLARNKVRSLCLVGAPGKTTRVMALGGDSSVRLFARGNQKNMSTVLPPPSLSPMESVLGVSYNREYSVVYVLVTSKDIWVYTTRTDPACRVAVWNVRDLQTARRNQDNHLSQLKPDSAMSTMNRGSMAHRATENGMGNELVTVCSCVCTLSSPVMMWTDEGLCSPIQQTFLLLGMEDGRILFMDPVVKGHKYMEFKLSKDVILYMKHDQTHNCLLTTSKLKDIVSVQVWSLPKLNLQHEFVTTPDICLLTRTDLSVFTGHTDGSVVRHVLVPTDDVGLYTTRAVPSLEDLLMTRRRPEHNGPILTLDACAPLNIVCSCSADGSVKIWDGEKVMLTEITLGEPSSPVDEQLSSACFLNERGDLLVAFKKHIFIIDHARVCPSIQVPDNEEDTFDKESDVLEDPAVLYDHGESDLVNLKNYLVPFDIEFSKDFLEGRQTIESMKEEAEPELVESESESEFSNAPTEIYLSPPTSPGHLSRIDLQMGSEVTKFDLEQQMVKTKKCFYEKGKRRGSRRQSRVTPRQLSKDLEPKQFNVELPLFGTSPGPSPVPSDSSLSRPGTPSSMSVSECEAELSDEEMKPMESQESAAPIQVVPPIQEKTELDSSEGQSAETKPVRSKYGLSHITLDVPSLMKAKPSTSTVRKLDHSHIKTAAIHALPQRPESAKPKREVKKKQLTGQRKLPPKGQKRPSTPVEKSTENSGHMETQESEMVYTDSALELRLDPTKSRAVTPALEDDRASTESDLGVGLSPTPYSGKTLTRSISGGSGIQSDVSGRESRLSEISSISMATRIQTDIITEEGPLSSREGGLTPEGQWVGQRGTGGLGLTGDQDSSLLSPLERNRVRRRPATSYVGAARVAAKMEGEQMVPRRPRTAVETQDEDDLQNMFEVALRKYRSHPGTPIEDDQWYRNMGNSFEDNWQDRMIERHHLLQLQKHVRAQSATHRRRLLEQRQKVKRKSLLGHEHCDPTSSPPERFDSSLDILEKMERANSVLGGMISSDRPNQHRPHRRPKTAHPTLRGVPKQELHAEKPFRLRLSHGRTANKELPKDRVDVRSYDPRNPKAVRPRSSKSIPSKCSHYLLVEQPREPDLIVASPMEEQLLAERFPFYRHRYSTSPIPPAEGTFGRQLSEKLTYSPFVHQMS